MKIFRSLSNALPIAFYMICGALLSLIYSELLLGSIYNSSFSQESFLLNRTIAQDNGNCQCPELLRRILELQKKTLEVEEKLRKDRLWIQDIIGKIGNTDREKFKQINVDFTAGHLLKDHLQTGFNVFSQNYIQLVGDKPDNTNLPIWSFNEKSLFRSSDGQPKLRMTGDKDIGIKRLISKAFQESCHQAIQKKKIKACSLMHGSLSIDLEKGIMMTLVLSEANKTSIIIDGKFRLQQKFEIGHSNLIKNKHNELHIITMISEELPISRLQDFLAMVKTVNTHKLKLFFYISIYGRTDKVNLFKRTIIEASKKIKNTNFKVIHLRTHFERAAARHHGVSMLSQRDKLMLFADIDISFNNGFLQRCQLYTKQGQSVYFPIVFSQYNPKFFPNAKKPLIVSPHQGMWRKHGHGNLCVFKSDYQAVGGFNVNITGWGSEDDELYQRFLANKSMTVVRFPDHGIFHRWHEKTCDITSLGYLRYHRCMSSKIKFETSFENMASLYFKQKQFR